MLVSFSLKSIVSAFDGVLLVGAAVVTSEEFLFSSIALLPPIVGAYGGVGIIVWF